MWDMLLLILSIQSSFWTSFKNSMGRSGNASIQKKSVNLHMVEFRVSKALLSTLTRILWIKPSQVKTNRIATMIGK